MVATPYIRDVICGTPQELDMAVKANIPQQLRTRWSGSYREAGDILYGDRSVGQYAVHIAFPYSGRVALDPQFQEITNLNPRDILESVAEAFR